MPRSRSFTLIEVLIAVAILATGLMAALYMFPLGMRQLKVSRILMDMSFFAKEKLEEIKTYNIVGDSSGTKGDLEWKISLSEESPLSGVSVRKVILNVKYNLEASTIEEEFVTYLSLEEEAGE